MNAPLPNARRAVVSWSMYDWANSAFPTLVITFVYATYYSQAIAIDKVTGTAHWAWAMSLSGLVVAILAPWLGASADRNRTRRRSLAIATWVSALATAALTWVAPDTAHAGLVALALVVAANVAFELGMVFYNAFLPGLASEERIGRVSGIGWALGYGGGLACLFIALLVLVRPDPLFGIATEQGFNYRATNLLVAGWFLVFSLPMLLWVPEPASAGEARGAGGAFARLRVTIGKIRQYREVARFLVARLIYNDGLVTVFAFGGIYAAGTFGMSLPEVIQFGIVINLAAGLGAWAFGYVDDKLGAKTTVLITLVALCGFVLIAVLAPTKAWLWVAAVGIGVFVGPNQSASRSLMGRLVPDDHQGEFFGFFAFSGKFTAFAGPLLLGLVTHWADSQRVGVATVLIFFVVGGAVMATVDEKAGIAAGKARDGDAGGSDGS